MKKGFTYYLRLTVVIALMIFSVALLINRCSPKEADSTLDTIEKNMKEVGYSRTIYTKDEEELFLKKDGIRNLDFTEPVSGIYANFELKNGMLIQLNAGINKTKTNSEKDMRLWIEKPLGLFLSANTPKTEADIKEIARLFHKFSQTILSYTLGKITLQPWGITDGGYNLFFPEISKNDSGEEIVDYVIIRCKEETLAGCKGY